MTDAKFFYTGLVASMYQSMRSVTPDADTYARFIELSGEPALEVGCGTGDPLLELRRRGFDVDGLDSSQDMLDQCRRRAADLGVEVTLYCMPMESMQLPRKYRSIFLAGPSFNLLPDDAVASAALAHLRASLAPKGLLLVPLFIPERLAPEVIGDSREGVGDDGAGLRLTTVAHDRDDLRRLQTTILRYESSLDGEMVTVERPWVLHWHDQAEFRQLATDAGCHVVAILDAAGEPASPDASEFAFVLSAA